MRVPRGSSLCAFVPTAIVPCRTCHADRTDRKNILGLGIVVEDFPSKLHRPPGILQDLYGLDPREIVEEPAAARKHLHGLALKLPLLGVVEVVTTGEDQDMFVFTAELFDEGRPPGEPAFLLGFSPTLFDLAQVPRLVAEHDGDLGESRALAAAYSLDCYEVGSSAHWPMIRGKGRFALSSRARARTVPLGSRRSKAPAACQWSRMRSRPATTACRETP